MARPSQQPCIVRAGASGHQCSTQVPGAGGRSARVSYAVRVTPGPLAVLVLACLVAAACSAPAFDPNGPCTTDGRAPGAYPDLESLVPRQVEGRPPDRIDSGRTCTERGLESLAAAGISELRFAGGLWERGSRSGTTLAVFRAAGLTSEALATWYEEGARRDQAVDDVAVVSFTVGRAIGRRIDSLVETSSFQSVIVWDAPVEGTVRAILVGTDVREQDRDVHEQAIEVAIAAWEPLRVPAG